MDVSTSPYGVLAEPVDARFASIPEPASSCAGRSAIAAIVDRYTSLAASLTNGFAVGARSTHVHLGG
jgi:hypothetical protein